MKQISIQITAITARQIAQLAEHWGLPAERHNTPVIERAVAAIHMFEIGYAAYQNQLAQTLSATSEAPTMDEKLRLFDTQVPLMLRVMENALRSGYNLKQTFEIVAADLPDPAQSEVRLLLADLNANLPFPEALNAWLNRLPSRDLNLLMGTLRAQFEQGGNLADRLQALGQTLQFRTPL